MPLSDLIKSVLQGILQGITEWLPVSSTGHMILFQRVLGMHVSDTFLGLYLVVIQLGSALAVLLLYRKQLFPCLFDVPRVPAGRATAWRRTLFLWSRILVAVLPGALVGFLLDDWFETHLCHPAVVAAALIIYGTLYLFMEKLPRRKNAAPDIDSPEAISFREALAIGAFQTLALIPGTSRSGSTILGATLVGLPRTAAAEFSFFLAIPTICGASLLKGVKYCLREQALPTKEEWLLLLAGTLTAFLVSCIVIRFLVDFVKKHTFAVFGIWRIALGCLVLFLLARGVIRA